MLLYTGILPYTTKILDVHRMIVNYHFENSSELRADLI